jgi:hypothetical protein
MANTRLTKNILDLISKRIGAHQIHFNIIEEIEPQKKALIIEKDILKLDTNQKILVVDKDTIITPLAKDRAKAMGIRIEKLGGA